MCHCLNQRVYFRDCDFIDGTFDFKLINLSDDCSNMFENCKSLTHLPDDFTLPDNIIDCSEMFNGCKSLKQLPNNFILPNNIIDCSEMF